MSKAEHSNRLLNEKGVVKNPGMLLGLQIAGILWLGVVPYYIFHYPFTHLVFGNEAPSIFQLCSLFTLLLVSITAAVMESGKINPEQNSNAQQAFRFNNNFIRRYIFLRAVFLASYEIFFRGYLLNDTAQRAGIFISIVLNIGLYSLLHIFNGRKEMIACIPFGFILCCLCLWFHAAWPAIVIHVVFALVYELRLVKKMSTINKTEYENFCYRLLGLHRK